MPSKAQAAERLRLAGHTAEADVVERYLNCRGNAGGWDGWFRRAYPSLVDLVGLPVHGTAAKATTANRVVNEAPKADFRPVEPYLRASTALRHLPDLIVHADWSLDQGSKRQLVRAMLADGAYTLSSAEVAPPALLKMLVDVAAQGKAVLAGFDFALGVPLSWVRAAKQSCADDLGDSFLKAIERLPPQFFVAGDDPAQIGWSRPFFPNSNTGWARLRDDETASGESFCGIARRVLGRSDASQSDLLRVTDFGHARRANPAAPLFILQPSKQVWKASISGWKELVLPALQYYGDRVRIWPFDGPLADLVEPGLVTIVETYPGESYSHLGISGNAKRSPHWRREAARRALDVAAARSVFACEQLVAAAEDGFGCGAEGEDPFDAMVGAIQMALVALGHDSGGDPVSESARHWEGWMLGRPFS